MIDWSGQISTIVWLLTHDLFATRCSRDEKPGPAVSAVQNAHGTEMLQPCSRRGLQRACGRRLRDGESGHSDERAEWGEKRYAAPLSESEGGLGEAIALPDPR
jgi:hypothetical protein